jgi:hypothetical protein
VREVFAGVEERISEGIDIQHEIAAQYSWLFDTGFAPRREAERTAFYIFDKSKYALFDALQLISRGAFGSARILLRQVFEGLMIAKVCMVSDDERLALKWRDGAQIYLGRDVFKRFQKPDPEPLSELWGHFSDYTHASRFAQQRTARIKDDIEFTEVGVSFVYLENMVECSYHLLNSLILRRDMVYYAREYGKNYTVPELRLSAKQHFRDSRVRFGPGAIMLLRTYKSTWTLSEPAHITRTHRASIPRDWIG